MSLLDSALSYAQLGWPVFPCDPRTKEPLVPRDKDAAGKPIPNTGGLRKATTDADTIRAWWTRWPKAMIAVATGEQSGVFVVDVDAGEDEKTGEVYSRDVLLARLAAEVGELPATWAVGTPRGGVHLYFKFPKGEADAHTGRPLGNRANLIKRVDTRGEGGYVFAPPSLRADGRPYAWETKPDFAAGPADATPALLDCILHRGKWDDRVAFGGADQAPGRAKRARPAAAPAAPIIPIEDEAVRRYALAAFDAELRTLRASVQGTRNENLFHASLRMAQLVAAGALDQAVARAGLESVAREWPNFAKSKGTIDSGWHKGLAEPRDLSEVRDQAAARARRYGSAREWPAADQAAGPQDLPPIAGPEDYGLPNLPAAPVAAHAGPPDAAAPGGADRETLPNGRAARGDRAAAQGVERDAERLARLNLRLAFYPQTDLGNAERFRERNEGKLLYCPEFGDWLWWDGRRWNRDGANGKVRIAEHECVRAIKDEAEALRHSGQDEVVGYKPATKRRKKRLTTDQRQAIMAAALAGDAELPPELTAQAEEAAADAVEPGPEPIYYSDTLINWSRECEFNSRLAKIADHAKSYLAVAARDLDADPFAINVRNGTLHVGRRQDRTAYVEFRRHNPRDKITKLAPVDYVPEAPCAHYDKFLAEVQPGGDNRRFLHQWAGYSLTGDVSEQRLVFFWGKGRNGKSTLVDIWGLIAGDYGTTSPIETFLNQGAQKTGSQATPDLAMLKGVRFVRTSEPDKGSKLGEALVKLATGGEPFPVRELHKSIFILFPQFKLTISGNYRPSIRGTDEGIWRRVTLVPWTVTIDKDKVDRQLGHKLKAEASGILNRMLDGLRDWLENNLIIPEDVSHATESYRRDSDPLGRFLDACVVHEPGAQVQSSAMHRVFNAWCKANGEREWTATGFGLAMSDRGFESKKSSVSWWLNLKLTKAESDFVDAHGNPIREDASTDAPEKTSKTGADDDVVPF